MVHSNSIVSGYKFLDDFFLLFIHKKLVNCQNLQDFFQVIKEFTFPESGFYSHRFIPGYWLHEFWQVLLFEINHLYHSIYIGVLGFLTSLFLFLSAKKAGFNTFESIIFPLVTLLGFQFSIWVEMHRAENFGMFIFSITLFLMILSIFSVKYNKIYKILFIIFAIILTLTKESFILVIPALLFWKLWLYKEKQSISFIKSIKNNLLVLIILLTVITLEVTYIYFNVGTNCGYAGVGDCSFSCYIYRFLASILFKKINIFAVISILLLFLYNLKIKNNKHKTNLLNYLYLAILFFLIIIPQMVLHSESGFFHRYLLPYSIGYSVIIIYFFKFLQNTNINNFLKIFCKILIVIICFFQFNLSYDYAKATAQKGMDIKKLINLVKKHSKEDSKIILFAHPHPNMGHSGTFDAYLKEFAKRENIYFYFVRLKGSKHYEDDYIKNIMKNQLVGYDIKTISNLGNLNAIKMFITINVNYEHLEEKIKKFINKNNFKIAEFYFVTETDTNITVYYKESD